MNDLHADASDRAAPGVNATVHYLFERAGWMLWPLAWVLVGAMAHFIAHL